MSLCTDTCSIPGVSQHFCDKDSQLLLSVCSRGACIKITASDTLDVTYCVLLCDVNNVRTSDVWLTVHRNLVWIRNQLDVTYVLSLFLL